MDTLKSLEMGLYESLKGNARGVLSSDDSTSYDVICNVVEEIMINTVDADLLNILSTSPEMGDFPGEDQDLGTLLAESTHVLAIVYHNIKHHFITKAEEWKEQNKS